jgi:integrase
MAKKWGPVALGNEIQTVRSMIPISIVDVEEGWLDYPRAKTAIDRRIPLWPETCKALKHVIFERREPVNEEDSELLFIGKRGQNYVGGRKGYRVTQEFDRVARRAGVVGRSFYDFRRTFETIAGEGGDQVAVDHIMGHAPGGNDMGAVYRQRISADRLLAVTNTVRAWLYGDDVVSLDESIALRVVG